MATLRIDRVTRRFGAVHALREVSLTVPSGEVLSLLGPSGCGKSTLLRVVAGLEDADAGSIGFDDRDVTTVPPGQRAVGMVFQEPASFAHRTVADNLAFGMKVRGVPADTRRQRIADTARLLGVEALLDRRPAELSGGERRRVEIGRALLRDPEVLLLDEPFSGLDANLRSELLEELRTIQARIGVTTLLVTHDQSEALVAGDHVAVMRAGRIAQLGTPADIYDRPADTFVARFVGTPPMNLLPVPPHTLGLPDPLGRSDVITGIRPSDLRLDGAGDRSRPAILIKVAAIADHGADLVLSGRAEPYGGALVMRLGRSERPAVDDVLRATITCWHVFDATTGARLGP